MVGSNWRCRLLSVHPIAFIDVLLQKLLLTLFVGDNCISMCFHFSASEVLHKQQFVFFPAITSKRHLLIQIVLGVTEWKLVCFLWQLLPVSIVSVWFAYRIVVPNVVLLTFTLITLLYLTSFAPTAQRIQLVVELLQPLESILPPLLNLRIFFFF